MKSVARFKDACRTEYSITVPQSCTGGYPEPSPPLLGGLEDAVRYADVSRCPAFNSANGLDAESNVRGGRTSWLPFSQAKKLKYKC